MRLAIRSSGGNLGVEGSDCLQPAPDSSSYSGIASSACQRLRGTLGETLTLLADSLPQFKQKSSSIRQNQFTFPLKKSYLCKKDSFYISQYFSVCLPSCAIKDFFTCSFPCSRFGPKRSPEAFSGVKRGKSSTVSEEKHTVL